MNVSKQSDICMNTHCFLNTKYEILIRTSVKTYICRHEKKGSETRAAILRSLLLASTSVILGLK